METHKCINSTAATDVLVLKLQAISNLSADETVVFGSVLYKISHLQLQWTKRENKMYFKKKSIWLFNSSPPSATYMHH